MVSLIRVLFPQILQLLLQILKFQVHEWLLVLRISHLPIQLSLYLLGLGLLQFLFPFEFVDGISLLLFSLLEAFYISSVHEALVLLCDGLSFRDQVLRALLHILDFIHLVHYHIAKLFLIVCLLLHFLLSELSQMGLDFRWTVSFIKEFQVLLYLS